MVIFILTDKLHVSVCVSKILTDYDKMILFYFLTDLGYLYSRFQKQIQTDDVLIFDIEIRKNTVVQMIKNLKVSPLLDGWEYIMFKKKHNCNL